MGWDNSFQTIIVLPSGATTGQRIVIDGQNGLILVYDPINDLIVSISPDDTTDSQGNTILRGVTSYENGGHEYAQLFNGGLNVGRYGPDAPAGSQSGYFATLGDNSACVVNSPTNDETPDSADITFRSGVNSSGTGGIDYPHAEVGADVWVPAGNASVIASVPSTIPPHFVAPETWHIVGDTGEPTYNAGWSGATAIGAVSPVIPLRYRLGIEDTLILEGTFTAASGAGAMVFQLPTAPVNYRPQQNAFYPIQALMRTSAGATSTVWLDISHAGNLNFSATLGSTVSTGATYTLPRTYVSLDNLPH